MRSSNIAEDSSVLQLYSPFLYDLLSVLCHMVVANDVIQAGQGLLNILLQALQILGLLMHRDD